MATSGAPDPGPARPKPRKLSEELADLRQRFDHRPVTLREVIYTLGGRAYMLLVILLALPFVTPIPLPGLSTPFGMAIGFIALRLTLGQRPWLPKKLQRKELPASFFRKVFAVAAGLIRLLEKLLRPRLAVLTGSGVRLQLHAFIMLIAAIVLLPPLPIPFSNTFPALVILLLAGGLLERDGVFVLAAYAVFAAGTFYFIFLGGTAVHLIEALKQWLQS